MARQRWPEPSRPPTSFFAVVRCEVVSDDASLVGGAPHRDGMDAGHRNAYESTPRTRQRSRDAKRLPGRDAGQSFRTGVADSHVSAWK